jgi:hypothetical protein
MKHPIPVIFLVLGLLFLAVSAHAAVNLQTCSVTPTSGGVMGCPTVSMTFTPVSSTSLVRSQVNSIQGWRPFNTLAANDEVYTADGNWHTLSSIQPALQPITPAPPIPPGVQTPPATVWVSMNWTCSIANNLATCTAPLTP